MLQQIDALVFTNDNCVGCNKCISACSCMGACISTDPDEHDKSRIEVDGTKCIACGACFDVCEHDARQYNDDTERFFADLNMSNVSEFCNRLNDSINNITNYLAELTNNNMKG